MCRRPDSARSVASHCACSRSARRRAGPLPRRDARCRAASRRAGGCSRDKADDQVKAFLVEKGIPGFETTKMEHKIALRCLQNADITLTDVVVPETDRLQEANWFMDTAGVLTMSRMALAWEATGCARGAYQV